LPQTRQTGTGQIRSDRIYRIEKIFAFSAETAEKANESLPLAAGV
jgi:hypothetical protein